MSFRVLVKLSNDVAKSRNCDVMISPLSRLPATDATSASWDAVNNGFDLTNGLCITGDFNKLTEIRSTSIAPDAFLLLKY